MITKVKSNVFIILLIIFFSFIFFYRLDYSTLASFDEAWYGSIAKEIVKTGDFMNLLWNGKPYYDHPPLGFWLMAFSYKIFGISEFSTRFPSAVVGLISIILIFKIGHLLTQKKIVGFVAGLILGTSVWYVIRVRSGNLESAFVFFYILTVYLSLKSAKDFRFFPLTALAFGALVLTKTLAGVSVIILILLSNIRQLVYFKKNLVLILMGVILFFSLVYPWYDLHFSKYPDFYNYHFVNIGMRNREISYFLKFMPDQALFYLHMGVRKWYRFWQAALVLGVFNLVFFISRRFIFGDKKNSIKIFNYFFLLIWNLIIIYPFLNSKETEIWHLIPAYVPLALIISFAFYDFVFLVISFIPFIKKRKESALNLIYLIPFLIIFLVQIKNFYSEVFPQAKYIPDEVDISKRLAKYKQEIFVDNDFLPIAVFYSGRKVNSIVLEADDVTTFEKLFAINDGRAVAATKNWVIDDLKERGYPIAILEKNSNYSIVVKKRNEKTN